ncbi:MAG: NAD(P)-binding protein [Chitinivibrionales bacterium]|nr:NAD(P)-binding protein [Chitinivibrionales bacterium]MBD3395087.1 NAD(P)-binding protein [Chitinivibrionales bacterium]
MSGKCTRTWSVSLAPTPNSGTFFTRTFLLSNRRKRVTIIGGGIGGLSAGCYLQMNGYDTRVLEMGHMCGGVCVSWKRRGYVFDGATNWLPGSADTINLHTLLAELIDFSKLKIKYSDIFIRVEHDGGYFNVYNGARKLRDEMMRIAPEDRGPIEEFTNAITAAAKLPIPFEKPPEAYSIADFLAFPFKNYRLIRFLMKWRGMTIGDYARRFRNPRMREMFLQIFPHHEFFSMFALCIALGWMSARSDGYPLGGSARFTEVILERYRELGGVVDLNKRVTEVLVHDGAARGVVCADGSRYDADVVVSSADVRETLMEILGGRYIDARTRRQFENWDVYPSLLQISLGVARTFEGEAPKLNIPLCRPIRMGEFEARDIMVRVCNFDPSLSPPGKTSLVVHIRTPDYAYWCDLRENNTRRYRAEKESVADTVIDTLERRFGRVKNKVEVCDVATPATFVRYTNIWKGSYQGWAPTPRAVGRTLTKTFPGLKDFYLAGMWAWPGGGLTGVIRLARDVAYLICRADNRQFTTT